MYDSVADASFSKILQPQLPLRPNSCHSTTLPFAKNQKLKTVPYSLSEEGMTVENTEKEKLAVFVK